MGKLLAKLIHQPPLEGIAAGRPPAECFGLAEGLAGPVSAATDLLIRPRQVTFLIPSSLGTLEKRGSSSRLCSLTALIINGSFISTRSGCVGALGG